jgi:hypothetical protein
MFRLIFLIISIIFLPSVLSAVELTTYWHPMYNYGIAYPSDWKPNSVDNRIKQDDFSLSNRSGNASIYITSDRFSEQNRGKYKNLYEVPSVENGLSDMIRNDMKGMSIDSGKTMLSNEPALWFTYYFYHDSLDTRIWFSAYQIVCLKNDIIYTLTVKVTGSSREQSEINYSNNWETIRNILMTFTLR